jgi:hypothetical protein
MCWWGPARHGHCWLGWPAKRMHTVPHTAPLGVLARRTHTCEHTHTHTHSLCPSALQPPQAGCTRWQRARWASPGHEHAHKLFALDLAVAVGVCLTDHVVHLGLGFQR